MGTWAWWASGHGRLGVPEDDAVVVDEHENKCESEPFDVCGGVDFIYPRNLLFGKKK